MTKEIEYEICDIMEDIEVAENHNMKLYFWPKTFTKPIQYDTYEQAEEAFKKGTTVYKERT